MSLDLSETGENSVRYEQDLITQKYFTHAASSGSFKACRLVGISTEKPLEGLCTGECICVCMHITQRRPHSGLLGM